MSAPSRPFNDNGGGVRGDLAAVVRAILTHPEAGTSSLTSGKLSEPALFVVSALRALNATVTDQPFMSDKAEAMGQKVLYPGSVFSYFSPGYRVRGTSGPGGAPLGGPEFQILTSVTALERTNFVADLLAGQYGTDVAIDYTPFTSRAPTPRRWWTTAACSSWAAGCRPTSGSRSSMPSPRRESTIRPSASARRSISR